MVSHLKQRKALPPRTRATRPHHESGASEFTEAHASGERKSSTSGADTVVQTARLSVEKVTQSHRSAASGPFCDDTVGRERNGHGASIFWISFLRSECFRRRSALRPRQVTEHTPSPTREDDTDPAAPHTRSSNTHKPALPVWCGVTQCSHNHTKYRVKVYVVSFVSNKLLPLHRSTFPRCQWSAQVAGVLGQGQYSDRYKLPSTLILTAPEKNTQTRLCRIHMAKRRTRQHYIHSRSAFTFYNHFWRAY